MSDPNPADLTAFVRQAIPIMDAMGIEVVGASRTEAAARMPIGPNGNHFGAAYAGCLFTVAEVLGGLFASTSLQLEGAIPLVKRIEIDFKRPATTDVIARTTLTEDVIERVLAETAANGKSDFELRAEVTDEAGTVVSLTRGDYQLRKLG